MKADKITKNKKNTGKGKIIYLFLIPLLLLLIAGITILFRHIQEKKAAEEAKQQYLAQLSSETYDSIFFSMFPLTNYSVEDFNTYLALTPTLSPYAISGLAELSEHIDAALMSGNEISNIYLGIDPYLIWTSSGKSLELWDENMNQYLLAYPEAYPDITFEIMLPSPPLEYWTGMTDNERETVLSTYRTAICALSSYPNTTVYFAGMQHWLIANPGNYADQKNINREISQKLTLMSFCDHHYQISFVDVDIAFDQFREYIRKEQENPTEYPNLSQWEVVFLGDSIIGNYSGSHSIPGVINGLSNASVYNYAIGGTPATSHDNSDSTFLPVVDRFLSQEPGITQDNTVYPYDTDDNKQLCFIINYGLNDYFNGERVSNPEDPYDVYTFAGALRSGIEKLRNAYPEAVILLQTPNFSTYYSNGTEVQSEAGGVLTDYVNAVMEVAESENVYYLDNYTALGITPDNAGDYLDDGCHLNEQGRFLAAERIIAFLEQH